MSILFVKALKQLYKDGKVAKEKIVELYNNKKITKEEMNDILEVTNK